MVLASPGPPMTTILAGMAPIVPLVGPSPLLEGAGRAHL